MTRSVARPSPEKRARWFTESSLRQSFRVGQCLVCSNLILSERHSIHSFLYEGMMSPDVRQDFLKGGGFCLRHFWEAKRIEERCWPAGGIGIALLCENLIRQYSVETTEYLDDKQRRSLSILRRSRKRRDFRAPGFGCVFCQDNEEREQHLLQTIQELMEQPAWSKMLEEAPLCLRHAVLALNVWQDALSQERIREHFQAHLSQLTEDIEEFIRKSDWQYRNEPKGREQDAVFRAIEYLVGLDRQFPGYVDGRFAQPPSEGELDDRSVIARRRTR